MTQGEQCLGGMVTEAPDKKAEGLSLSSEIFVPWIVPGHDLMTPGTNIYIQFIYMLILV